MIWPTWSYWSGFAVLTSERPGWGTAWTVALAWFELIDPLLAVALFVTLPASRSDCVIV